MAAFSSKKLILFDFDGVIVDSMGLSLKLNKDLWGKEWDIDEYRDLFTGNVYEKLEANFSEHSNDEKYKEFAMHYGERIHDIAPFEAVDMMLKKLASPRTAYIVSSSSESVIEEYLITHKINAYFDGVYGFETDKSKVKKFRQILQKEGLSPNDCVFITDTLGDILEADEIGIDSLAVTWGFHTAERFQNSNHHSTVDTMEQLMNLF